MLGQTRNLALVVRIRRMLKSLSIVVLVAATAACGGAKTSGAKPTVVADPGSAFGPLQEGADYQTYTKMSKAPFASPTHGGRDVEVWVNAAGVEAYKKGEPSPAGTIIVKSSTEKADDGSSCQKKTKTGRTRCTGKNRQPNGSNSSAARCIGARLRPRLRTALNVTKTMTTNWAACLKKHGLGKRTTSSYLPIRKNTALASRTRSPRTVFL